MNERRDGLGTADIAKWLKREGLSNGAIEEAIHDAVEESRKRFSEKMISFPYFDGSSGNFEEDVGRILGKAQYDYGKAQYGGYVDWKYVENMVATRLMFKRNLVVYEVSDEANIKIVNTNMDFIPEELPLLLEGAFLVEKKDDVYLYDDVTAIFGYSSGDHVNINFLRYMDDGEGGYDEGNVYLSIPVQELLGNKVQKLVQGIVVVDEENNVLDKKEYMKAEYSKENQERIKRGLQFILVFGYMISAEKTPFETSNRMREIKSRNGDGKKERKTWIERHISLSKQYKRERLVRENEARGALDKEGKIKEEVVVRGFLRQQAYGKEWKMRKTIWIEEFKRSQWVTDGNIKYIVKG